LFRLFLFVFVHDFELSVDDIASVTAAFSFLLWFRTTARLRAGARLRTSLAGLR
jgi:hypothetical protein